MARGTFIWAPGINHHTDPLGCMTKRKTILRLGKHRPPGSNPPSSRGQLGHSPFEPRPKEGGADKSTARNFFARGEARGSSRSPSQEVLILQEDAGLGRALPSCPPLPESAVGGSHAGLMPGPCHVRRAQETAAGSLRLRLDKRSSGEAGHSGTRSGAEVLGRKLGSPWFRRIQRRG